MSDARLVSAIQAAPWLPAGSTAEAWAGHDCAVPDPCIIVRLLLARRAVSVAEFFCVPTARGLDLPSLALGSGSTPAATAEGFASLVTATHAGTEANHICVGYIRNVVPNPDSSYPHPTPWAHVPVFRPVEAVEPARDGTWVALESARSDLSARHWWPIVEHHLCASPPTTIETKP